MYTKFISSMILLRLLRKGELCHNTPNLHFFLQNLRVIVTASITMLDSGNSDHAVDQRECYTCSSRITLSHVAHIPTKSCHLQHTASLFDSSSSSSGLLYLEHCQEGDQTAACKNRLLKAARHDGQY